MEAVQSFCQEEKAEGNPQDKLKLYLESGPEAKDNVIAWWGHQTDSKYPTMRQIARDYLAIQGSAVMTVCLELSFFFYPLSIPLLLLYYTTDTFLLLLVIALSWTYLLTPRLGQDALQTACLLPYLLHALPSPLLYHLRVHRYLLMCTLCAPFVPVSPHCCLMYHCTSCACFLTP